MSKRTELRQFVTDVISHIDQPKEFVNSLTSQWCDTMDHVCIKMRDAYNSHDYAKCLVILDNIFLMLSRLIADLRKLGLPAEEAYSKRLFAFYCKNRKGFQDLF